MTKTISEIIETQRLRRSQQRIERGWRALLVDLDRTYETPNSVQAFSKARNNDDRSLEGTPATGSVITIQRCEAT